MNLLKAVACRIFRNNDFPLIKAIEETVKGIDGVICAHNVRIVPYAWGRALSLDLTLAGNLTLTDAFEITRLSETTLRSQFPQFSKVKINPGPDGCATCKKKALELKC